MSAIPGVRHQLGRLIGIVASVASSVAMRIVGR
jgi:hypothetical protein